jgi:hypothetical protein
MRLPWQRGGDQDDAVARTASAVRDERLSEYLDGSLSRPDRAVIEADAERDHDARLALEGMRAVRATLGEMGMVRAPRSFTLDASVAPRQHGLPRLELYARLATAAAAVALTATSLVPAFTGGSKERAASSVADSFTAATAAPVESRKESGAPAPQATPQQAPQPVAPATAATGLRAAPALDGASGAGAAPQAAPAGPASTVTAVTSMPALPSPSERPVEISNGTGASASDLRWAQVGLGAATVTFAVLTIGMWLRRRARGGV